jgi:hypothetical protein
MFGADHKRRKSAIFNIAKNGISKKNLETSQKIVGWDGFMHL